MAENSSDSQFFFSGNIDNMIPEGPPNKMVPLTKDHMSGDNVAIPVLSNQIMTITGMDITCHWADRNIIPRYKYIMTEAMWHGAPSC